MYTTAWCGYCRAAKLLLERSGLDYDEVPVDDDPNFRQRMIEISGRHTVPQIFIDGASIGGYQELTALIARDGLAAGEVAPASA